MIETPIYYCPECFDPVKNEPMPHRSLHWNQTSGEWIERTVRLCLKCCPRLACADCAPRETTND